MKRRGSQRGRLEKRGPSWIVRFRRHIVVDDKVEYLRTSERVGPAEGHDRLTKNDARIEADKIIDRANALAKVPQMQATLRQFVEARFQPEHVAGLRTKGGRDHYRLILKNHVIPALGDVKLADITRAMVQLILSTKSETLSQQTVRHIRNAFSAIFHHAKLLGFWTGDLPTEGVKCYGSAPKIVRPLSLEQVKLILENLSPTFRPLVMFLTYTGLRIGEAAGLRWSRVNLSDRPVMCGPYAIPPYSILIDWHYRAGESTQPKTHNSVRIVPLPSAAWVALQEMRERDKSEDEELTVFRGKRGLPLDYHNFENRNFKPACVKAGVPWAHPHCLRHTLASTPGIEPLIATKVLGHGKDGRVTMRYQHPDLERARQQMEAVN